MLNLVRKSAEYRKIYDQGEKSFSPFFILFITPNNQPGLEVGITVTKKLGNAVIRNRIKRRLRALALSLNRAHPQTNLKVIIVAKKAALEANFAKMLSSLESLLAK